MSTVCWTTYGLPDTLINVGMEAVAMLCDNIVCFTDLKKRSKAYYKADNAAMGAGISLLIGHNRFPLFACAEAVLRPCINIIKYPEMSKFAVFTTTSTVSYTDMCFSNHDYLVAITGYPNYKLRVWNFRTQQLIAEETTHKRVSAFSLACSMGNIPRIIQFSVWTKQLICWEMCVTAASTSLHEIFTVTLPMQYSESVQFSFCFSDDGNLYIVNDFGSVVIAGGQFHFKKQWAPDERILKPRRHSINYHKQGFLVANAEVVYFIKRNVDWTLEWTVSSPNEHIHKIISTFNNEVYAVNRVGNLYRIDVETERGTMAEVSVTNQFLLDFATLSGVREETILMLNKKGELRLVEILRMYQFSTLTLENAKIICAHNHLPFVAVGTTTGNIHFISYEKLRDPVPLAVVELGDIHLKSIRMLDITTLATDTSNRFYLVLSNLKTKVFTLGSSTEPQKAIYVRQSFMFDEEHFITFITRDMAKHQFYATEVWNYQWLKKQKQMRIRKFVLPYKYRKFALPNVVNKDYVEFYGIRINDNLIDGFQLRKLGELVLTFTIRTTHISNLAGIQGMRNLMTWGVDGTVYHFRVHKKSPKPYMITRFLQTNFVPRIMKKVADFYNGKFLAMLDINGMFKILKLVSSADTLRENTIIPDTDQVIEAYEDVCEKIKQTEQVIVKVFAADELKCRADILSELKALGEEVSKLIDYDISVTGKTHGVFRKFCLNFKWLAMLNEEARILCDAERKSLMESIADQSRIRDWIMNLVTRTTAQFNSKLRAMFSNTHLENYGVRTKVAFYADMFDLYRFYDMLSFDEDNEMTEEAMVEPDDKGKGMSNVKKRWVVEGSAFEHAMAEEFAMQDKNDVTSNQMHNFAIKFRVFMENMLKEEFNKKFLEVKKYKQEMMDTIINTNGALRKIYSNMNCMLCLLKMDTFVPPALSVPEWQRDEVIERILTVDDSEIKAINRRKKKQDITASRGGRMLLWSFEFWVRALNVMMDGVLEKLWEEEIKKEIPMPEFMLKKQDHEFTLEDQKQLREYEERLRLLAEDRRKYLRMLKENEKKTLDLKTSHILKVNERIAASAVLKLKYDFLTKQSRIASINTKIYAYNRVEIRKRIAGLRSQIDNINVYINKNTKLSDFWEKSVNDVKEKLEFLISRDKNFEREFKGKYLNSIPAHLTPEMSKLFRRRPKVLPKSFNSTLVFMEVASRITQKSTRSGFPLPNELAEYWKALDALDDMKTCCPSQLDPKHWDIFVRLRRQKIESELKVKGIGLQLLDAQKLLNSFAKDIEALKSTKYEASDNLEETVNEYFEATQNRTLQITLSMGQVEIALRGSLVNLRNSILMNLDDVNAVNELIRKTGAKKLKAMEKVAFFRRQVIYKEWEHKVVRANIDYLKYMLQVIEKCRISMEFLQILRNWEKVKAQKAKTANAVGLIEHVIEQKIAAFRKNLDRIIEKIDIVKLQIDHERRKSQQINKQINEIKVSVAFSTANRDVMVEEKRLRERNDRMAKIKAHRDLIDTVRRDYAHILELTTILELQRLRTYPTLGPAPPECT